MTQELQVGQAVIIRISGSDNKKELLDAYVQNITPLTFKAVSKGLYAGLAFTASECEMLCTGQKELRIYWFRKSTGTGEQRPGEIIEMPRHYIYSVLAYCEVTAWEQIARALDHSCSLDAIKKDFRLAQVTTLNKEGLIFYDSCGPVGLFSVADEPCANFNQLRLC